MTPAVPAAPEALAERLVGATVGALELFAVHLGWRLGLYDALSDSGPLTVDELAAAAGIDGRYAREWLEQQAVAGFLAVDTSGGHARFSLPPEHAAVLADPSSPMYVAAFAPMVVGIAGALPEVVAAYRTGGGVPYRAYGADFREGQGAINRPVYECELPGWLAGIDEVDQRLRAEPPARVADLGCGLGHSTTAIARAYPRTLVDGIDDDTASVDAANDRVAAAGLGDRVRFRVADATGLAAERYDLVCVFEALHDLARPVEVLAAARGCLADGGAVLVVDERVAPEFGAPGDQVERMMYGWSVTHCLPASRHEPGSAALGTVLRVATVERLAAEAGFGSTVEHPIDNDFFRCYVLRP